MFGFKRNRVGDNLLEEKCLKILKPSFEKWLQNTYEALGYEQLEGISKYAKEIYNIDDEEFAKIIATKPTPLTGRGKRRELNLYDDACLMNEEDIHSLKWTIDGKEYNVKGTVSEPPKKYTVNDIKVDYIKEAKEFIKLSKEFINKYGGWESIIEDLTVYKALQICISNLESKINEMEMKEDENNG